MSLLSITLNPALRLPEAIAVGALFLVTAFWLALRGNEGARTGIRYVLLVLRLMGLLAICVLWLNPGKWIEEQLDTKRDWLVLLDRSRSMETSISDQESRWQAATRVANSLRKATSEQGKVRVRTFSTQLEDELDDLGQVTASGDGTDIIRSVTGALDQKTTPLAGLVVISDGRMTTRTKVDEVAKRAQGRGVPIHTMLAGGSGGVRDLVLTALPRQVTAYKGQAVKISAVLENRGLGAIRPSVVLIGPDGNELGRKEASIAEGQRASVVFELGHVPKEDGTYTLRTAVWPGEHIASNNSDSVHVKVLASKTRVLLLEGAPYWDSKFLAQLLRQQGAVDILTVYRLNDARYFRVESGGAEPLQSADSVFPASATELARYDLIVFGKGADGFLDPARVAALQGFVRDQGGSILFARGKPYSGRFQALESLEPVEWGGTVGGAMKFSPLADAGAGLFGAALPAADDLVWPTLPLLEDINSVAKLKPFARVLADAVPEGRSTRTPMLIVRRFGRGMVATVNADGLWRWDFRPEIREQGALYQHFWVQLMQWCATYSDFRPGEDFAVRLRDATAEPGQSIRAVVSWRGPEKPEPKPVVKIFRNGQPYGETVANVVTTEESGKEWAAIFTPTESGRYDLQVADASKMEKLQGGATITVLAPPAEDDDLRPDGEALATLAQLSGGDVWALEDVEKLAARLWQRDATVVAGKPRWESLWPVWWVAALVSLVFGLEWWIRRREGLL